MQLNTGSDGRSWYSKPPILATVECESWVSSDVTELFLPSSLETRNQKKKLFWDCIFRRVSMRSFREKRGRRRNNPSLKWRLIRCNNQWQSHIWNNFVCKYTGMLSLFQKIFRLNLLLCLIKILKNFAF